MKKLMLLATLVPGIGWAGCNQNSFNGQWVDIYQDNAFKQCNLTIRNGLFSSDCGLSGRFYINKSCEITGTLVIDGAYFDSFGQINTTKNQAVMVVNNSQHVLIKK